MRSTAIRMTVMLWVLVGLMLTVGQPMDGDPLSMLGPVAAAFAQATGCEDWERGVIRGVGKAAAPDWARNPAQAHILAIEGAKTMAYKELAACIAGVRVAGGATVEKATTEDQAAKTAVQGVIKGARVVQEEVVTVAGAPMGVATLEIRLQGDQGLGGKLPPRWRGDTQKTEALLSSSPQPRQEGQPSLTRPAVDGLILDARGLSARPALYPEVIAEGGRTVYHWHGVDREHREVFGRVTNTVEKAKALLQEQGAAHPLVVKVSRMEGPTNYVLSVEDAKSALDADWTTQLLRKSRVVFVLGL